MVDPFHLRDRLEIEANDPRQQRPLLDARIGDPTLTSCWEISTSSTCRTLATAGGDAPGAFGARRFVDALPPGAGSPGVVLPRGAGRLAWPLLGTSSRARHHLEAAAETRDFRDALWRARRITGRGERYEYLPPRPNRGMCDSLRRSGPSMDAGHPRAIDHAPCGSCNRLVKSGRRMQAGAELGCRNRAFSPGAWSCHGARPRFAAVEAPAGWLPRVRSFEDAGLTARSRPRAKRRRALLRGRLAAPGTEE